ncbi:MAG: thiosulfate oxidation carrier complex protein SoxZ [Alphaproteobacteria bacterium]|jgi:sulfur-oxidizing protein SoxZ|nr:thiosulfate oxidation carrier complex protein SoxZ [Alphaproteobacteria bacterium]
MAKIKPRVKVPKTAAAGDIVEIKALISHPMHTGRAKDKKGNKIPRKIINKFIASFDGQDVFTANFEPAVSANPYIAFPFKASKSGEFTFKWVEDGGAEYTASKKMAVS